MRGSRQLSAFRNDREKKRERKRERKSDGGGRKRLEWAMEGEIVKSVYLTPVLCLEVSAAVYKDRGSLYKGGEEEKLSER